MSAPDPGTAPDGRTRLAVVKFTSCDGCQLSVLDCEDQLLRLAGAFDIVHFPEASRRSVPGPWDVVLVEGSISTPEEARTIQEVRRRARTLVTIGACATHGGIQALRNHADAGAFVARAFPRPEEVASLATSTAIADHVPVDVELHGCPIDPRQLLEVLAALLAGRRPSIPRQVTCLECKARGLVCVVVAHGLPCLGPVTHGGCGALCPAHDRGCYGCFGALDRDDPGTLHALNADRARLTVDGRDPTPGIRDIGGFGSAIFPPAAGPSAGPSAPPSAGPPDRPSDRPPTASPGADP